MHPALEALRDATEGTKYEGELWLVGGAVRDDLLGNPPSADFDIVLTGSAPDLAQWLRESGVSTIDPVVYPRFGTAMVRIEGTTIEFVTARAESYEEASRKPIVRPATLVEDALRRDFTVNALMRNLSTGELQDPTGKGLEDLDKKTLRTPLDPKTAYYDDPLRMLRTVRFRRKLGFQPAPGLYEAVRDEANRLKIISAERIRDEFVKMLALPNADDCLRDLLTLNLLHQFAPEFEAMVGVEQGSYHHLDVWDHTLLVLRNAGTEDLVVSLAALFHDIGKPATRSIDDAGRTRFFSHEIVGAKMTRDMMGRLKFSNAEIDAVARLVKNHMRFGSAESFSPAAARRIVRDLGDDLDRLLKLVDADARGLKAGLKVLDVEAIRRRIDEVRAETPAHRLESPLNGAEIMKIVGAVEGPEVGRLKGLLVEKVLEGELAPGDKIAAANFLKQFLRDKKA